MSYCPGSKAAATYSPSPLHLRSREVPLAVFVMTIPAPGTMAPDWSRIVPVTDAVSCASTMQGIESNTLNAHKLDFKVFFRIVHPHSCTAHVSAEREGCQVSLLCGAMRRNPRLTPGLADITLIARLVEVSLCDRKRSERPSIDPDKPRNR